MHCPACQSLLSAHTVDGHEVEVCQACHGLLLDHHELRRSDAANEALGAAVLALLTGTPRPANTARRYTCPRCSIPMMRSRYRPHIEVTVDTCPKCAAVWLDGGELQRIRGEGPDDAHHEAQTHQAIGRLFEETLIQHQR